MSTHESVLSVQEMSVSLPHSMGKVQAVREVSFEVGRGDTVCIVGESGCGKSMSAMAILNLLPRGSHGSIGMADQTRRLACRQRSLRAQLWAVRI